MDAQKIEWERDLEMKLQEHDQRIRNELSAYIQQLESKCKSVQQEKDILEKQVTDLRTTLFNDREGENDRIHEQIQLLTNQIEDAKSEKESLLLEQDQTISDLKNSYDNRISEMIKSHATSILAMQERVTQDVTSQYQQRLQAEKDISEKLKATLSEQSILMAAVEQEKKQAVKDAKKRMYDKVTQQFEAGNAKHDALKKSYKDCQDKLNMALSEFSVLKDTKLNLEQQLQQSHEEKRSSEDDMRKIRSLLAKLISAFSICPVDDANATEMTALEMLEKIENGFASNTSKILELKSKEKEYELEICKLQDSLCQVNDNFSNLTAENDQAKEALAATKEQLKSRQSELDSCHLEKESQMLVIANLITEKGKIESELSKANNEKEELAIRCEDLRKMNDEVMSMLEKMYAEKN